MNCYSCGCPADFCEISVNQLSMLLTPYTFTTATYSFTNTIQPQVQWDTTQYFTDTLNWVKISGKFIAQGGEEYLTLGNFKDGTHTKKTGIHSNFTSPETSPSSRQFSFVFIDDVALYELPSSPLTTTNYTLCTNSTSISIGDSARLGTTYQWFANGVLIDTTASINVKPPQTTTYVLQTKQCGITTQSVAVTINNCNAPIIPDTTQPIVPNVITPNNDGVNDTFTIQHLQPNTGVVIYNRWGNELLNTNSYQNNWPSCDLSAGVYFYIITTPNGTIYKGYVTVFR